MTFIPADDDDELCHIMKDGILDNDDNLDAMN